MALHMFDVCNQLLCYLLFHLLRPVVLCVIAGDRCIASHCARKTKLDKSTIKLWSSVLYSISMEIFYTVFGKKTPPAFCFAVYLKQFKTDLNKIGHSCSLEVAD